MCMMMDDQAAIRLLDSEGSVGSSKHVDIQVIFICDYAIKGIVK